MIRRFAAAQEAVKRGGRSMTSVNLYESAARSLDGQRFGEVDQHESREVSAVNRQFIQQPVRRFAA